MDGIPEDMAKEALRLAAHKLPLKTKFISKRLLALQAAEAKKVKAAKGAKKAGASAGA
jgi:large subunit ribosomal protein L16